MGNDVGSVASIYPAVEEVTKQLTDRELHALYLSAQLGTTPTSASWYKKVKTLYTQHDSLHELTKKAIQIAWEKRNVGRIAQPAKQ